jgi:hypothetical protein
MLLVGTELEWGEPEPWLILQFMAGWGKYSGAVEPCVCSSLSDHGQGKVPLGADTTAVLPIGGVLHLAMES